MTRRTPPSDPGYPHELVVSRHLLHGVGANGADLAPLGQHWRSLLPTTAFEAPDAPFAFDQGGSGRQWFSITGVNAGNRGERIRTARAAFDTVVSGLIAAHGLSDRSTASPWSASPGLDHGARRARHGPLAGRRHRRLRRPPRDARAARAQPATRTLLIHGTADPVIPAEESKVAEAALKAAGADISLSLQPNVGHTIGMEGAALAAGSLARAALRRGRP